MALGIAHTNFPNQKLAVAAIFLYLLLSIILSVPYISWVKRANAAKSPTGKHAEA